MESLVDIVLTGENLRTIILMVVIVGGFLLQNAKMDKRFVEVKAEIATVRGELKADIAATEARLNSRIDALKFNDFAHLGNAFKNLTYVLEKKQLIDAGDKAFIDKALEDT
ncbi:MAG: hypothetical protein LBR23_06495 [Spirochaetaceae bacterium]|jgi:hypothetical protein|nr:hypothetical protein [Spirochaetaceae bacterium]